MSPVAAPVCCGVAPSLPWVEKWMETEWLPFVAEGQFCIVSGGAIGIDQRAHRTALRSGTPTLAVLPSGLEAVYPKNLSDFSKCEQGASMAFLSEYLPGSPMRKHYFYSRNRLISALSPSLFVVQAHLKSGTMITAKYALEQGRSIYTLAADPVEPRTLGNLQLLFDGAGMIRWKQDLDHAF